MTSFQAAMLCITLGFIAGSAMVGWASVASAIRDVAYQVEKLTRELEKR